MKDAPLAARSVVTAVVALSLHAGCAGAWKRYETRHLNMYTDMSFAQTEVARGLEYQYAIMASSFFSKNATEKVDVLLLDEVPFTRMFGSYRPGMTLSRSPGRHEIGKNGLIVVELNSAPSYGSTLVSYWFIDKAVPKAPLWFHEGFARFAGGAFYMEGGGKAVSCFGRRWSQADDVLMSVNDMANATWAEYEAKYRGWLPYSGAVFFDWLLYADNGVRRGSFADVVNQLASGVPTVEALTSILQMPVPQLDEALKLHRHTWVARGMCPLGFPIKPEFLPDTDPPRMHEIAPEPVDALLASLASLPEVEGYADYYPAAIIEQSEAKSAGKKR